MKEFIENGSGLYLKRCSILYWSIAKYQPFRRQISIPTPKYIPPRSVINVKNKDKRCFEWAILSALHRSNNRNVDGPGEYQVHLGELNFDGIDFPVKVTDVVNDIILKHL